MISVIQALVNTVLSEDFRSTAFYSPVGEAVEKFVSAPQGIDAVTTIVIDTSAFTVPVAKFIKHELEKNSLEKAKMKERFNKLAESANEKNIKEEDGILTKKMDSVPSPSPSTETSDDKKSNTMAYSTSTSSDESDILHCQCRRRESRSRRHCIHLHKHSSTLPAPTRDYSKSGPKVLVPVNERYQKFVDYRSYRLIQKPHRNGDEVTTEMLMMPEKVAD